MYMYMYMYIRAYVYIYIYIYTCVWVCVRVRLRDAFGHVCMDLRTFVDVYACMCGWMHMRR